MLIIQVSYKGGADKREDRCVIEQTGDAWTASQVWAKLKHKNRKTTEMYVHTFWYLAKTTGKYIKREIFSTLKYPKELKPIV